MLTDKEINNLVCMIASGNNTYRNIRKLVSLDFPNNYMYIADYFKKGCVFIGHAPERIGLVEFETVPEDYAKDYQFKDEDKFRLTIKGQNLYDKCTREERLYLYTKIAAIASVIAAVSTVIMPLLKR